MPFGEWFAKQPSLIYYCYLDTLGFFWHDKWNLEKELANIEYKVLSTSVLFWQQVTMHFPKSAFYHLILGQKTRNSNWNQNIVNYILQLQTILLKTFDLLFVLRLLSSTFPSLLLLSSPFQNFSTWKNGLFKNAWIWMFCFYYYHHNKGIVTVKTSSTY